VSAATDAADRPGLSAALLALHHPPKVDGFVVARLDRLARALTVQEATLAVAWQADGHVSTADSGEVLRDDPCDPMHTALGQVVGVFAELDRRMVVKRLHYGWACRPPRDATSPAATPTARKAPGRAAPATPPASTSKPLRCTSWSCARRGSPTGPSRSRSTRKGTGHAEATPAATLGPPWLCGRSCGAMWPMCE